MKHNINIDKTTLQKIFAIEDIQEHILSFLKPKNISYISSFFGYNIAINIILISKFFFNLAAEAYKKSKMIVIRDIRLNWLKKNDFALIPKDAVFTSVIIDSTLITDLDINNLIENKFIGLNVKNIIINFKAKLTTQTLTNITTVCKNIIKMKITWYSNMSKTDTANILDNCDKLKYLDFTDCRVMNDEFVKNLSHIYQNIIALNFTRCWRLTNKSIEKILITFPNISHINLKGCNNINQDGINMLAQNLHNIHIYDPNGVEINHNYK